MNDLVTQGWAAAKCPMGDLFLAGYEGNPGERSALLSSEPKVYTEGFIATVEEYTGCTFERVPVDDIMALHMEYDHWMAAYARVENKNYWSDTDRQWWSTLATRTSDLRRAIKELGE